VSLSAVMLLWIRRIRWTAANGEGCDMLGGRRRAAEEAAGKGEAHLRSRVVEVYASKKMRHSCNRNVWPKEEGCHWERMNY